MQKIEGSNEVKPRKSIASIAKEARERTGKSTKEIGREKCLEAAAWIYRFEYSSPKILSKVCGSENGSAVRLLMAGDYVRVRRTARGGFIEGVPMKILTLKPRGVGLVSTFLDDRNRKDFGYRAPTDRICYRHNIAHDIKVQELAASKVRQDRYLRFKTEYEMIREDGTAAKTRVDHLFYLYSEIGDNVLVGLEVEMTRKNGRSLCLFMDKVIGLIEGKLSLVIISFEKKSDLDFYKRNFEPGRKYQNWEYYEANGKWRCHEGYEKTVPEWAHKKIIFITNESFSKMSFSEIFNESAVIF